MVMEDGEYKYIHRNNPTRESAPQHCEVYSRWHRAQGGELRMVDVDHVEICGYCGKPLLFAEVARQGGTHNVHTKPHTLTKKLAQAFQVPGYVVMYEVVEERIVEMEVRKVAPVYAEPEVIQPYEWALRLDALHRVHETDCQSLWKRDGIWRERAR